MENQLCPRVQGEDSQALREIQSVEPNKQKKLQIKTGSVFTTLLLF